MQAILAPTTCGSCGSVLVWRNDLLFCEDSRCPAQISKQIEHFAKTLKIKGLGPKTIEKLSITTLWELYALDYDLTKIALSSERLADKLFVEIEHSKKATLNQLLPAFSIPLVGKTATEKLSTTISGLNELSMDKCRDAGLGAKTAESLMDWYENEWINNFEFLPFDFKFAKAKERVEAVGTVCISGKLKSFPTKSAATTALCLQGYNVKSSVTKDVTILVNESGIESAKTKKARDSGVTIVTNLLNFLGETNGNIA
jgi:NAD-dependent DNA ligase